MIPETNADTTEQSTDSDTISTQLHDIRRDLLGYRPDITDDDLRELVSLWLILESTVEATSSAEYVSRELGTLKRDYPMRRTADVQSGADAFPNRCEGCEYYGTACPMTTSYETQQRIEYIEEQADTPEAYRSQMRDIAREKGCHVVLNALDHTSNRHGPLVSAGQHLLMEVEESVLFPEGDAVTRAFETVGVDSREHLRADLEDIAGRMDIGRRERPDGDTDRPDAASDTDSTDTTPASEGAESPRGPHATAPDGGQYDD